jgi:GNAT superfamily N-acetyltransferase
MTSVLVRAATPEDAPALAELRWEFRAAGRPPVESHESFVARCAGWMRAQLMSCELWHAWVAERQDRIVGQIWLQTVGKLPNPVSERERHAYLSNLFVTPDARGGVGARLLSTAIAWCETIEVDSILLTPTPRSRPLYRRHGFSERVTFLELKLPRGAN